MKFETAKLVYFYDKMLDLVLSGKMAAIDNTYDEQCFLLLNVRTMAGDFMGSRTVRVSELFDTYDECVEYTEWHAAEAAKQKALELLNIKL